ncbi:MAG: NAD(P)H-hydrate dehydratase [Fidelibacterota bacterium]|nr:MAG: NAD(P)H-hydrate dehydratase [Candidatus Neomarinimicrobiota bacterium]
MIKVLTTARSQALDRHTVRSGHNSEVDLMRNAGRAIAIETGRLLRADTRRPVLVVCGKGHNGGDGVAAAGFLSAWGYSCTVALLGTLADMDEVVSEIYREAGIEVRENTLPDDVGWVDHGLVIDAILGIGTTQPLREPVDSWVQAINEYQGLVLAVDVPSGLGTDNGKVYSDAVQADVTVTMGYPKLGLLINSGPDYSGQVVTADIGFDSTYFDEDERGIAQFISDDFRKLYRLPLRQTFKHRQGKTLVIAGSLGMTGAAVLAARATILSGSGLTVAACPASIQHLYVPAMPEVITLSLEDHGQGMFLPEHVSAIRESLAWCTGVVLGPGLSRSPQVKEFVRDIFEHLDAPTLLDADGLTPFNQGVDMLSAAEVPLVITPHAQEFAQLFDHDLEEVMSDPVRVLSEVQAYFPHTVVLKGAPTLTLRATGEIVVNSTGNPGMATAGSGDVLSGIIGTLLSQGYGADEAAIMGVWLHGQAGDMARGRFGIPGMSSLHILEQVPQAFDVLKGGS